jgi:hypothetical protein
MYVAFVCVFLDSFRNLRLPWLLWFEKGDNLTTFIKIKAVFSRSKETRFLLLSIVFQLDLKSFVHTRLHRVGTRWTFFGFGTGLAVLGIEI